MIWLTCSQFASSPRANTLMLKFAWVRSIPTGQSGQLAFTFCTNAPRTQWSSEAQARERFRAQDYVLVKYKVSSGNCHEFYAVDAQGTVVESYLHPITGETVRSTRMPPLPSAPAKH